MLFKVDINHFGNEAQNCAVLDCACSSTVCGQQWLESYLNSLNDSDKEKFRNSAGNKIKLDFEHDSAEIYGKLNHTSSGHYSLCSARQT